MADGVVVGCFAGGLCEAEGRGWVVESACVGAGACVGADACAVAVAVAVAVSDATGAASPVEGSGATAVS